MKLEASPLQFSMYNDTSEDLHHISEGVSCIADIYSLQSHLGC